MKALVTGASGFVGSAVVRALLHAGHDVRVLLREDSDRRNLAELDVETVIGDLREPESLQEAVQGCSALFHAAADYRLWSPNPREFYEINVNGTRNMLRAAAAAGVDRIVYTSSVCTLGLQADGSPSDETVDAAWGELVCDYKRSKYLAEQAVRDAINREGLPVVIVNPSTPVGPGDIKPTPTGRVIQEAVRGRIPAYVDTGLNIVHVDDVGTGHVLALEKGRIGERYILGGDNLTLAEILGIVAELSGHRPPRLRLPSKAVLPIAWMSEFWARHVSGREPLTTVAGVRMSSHRMFFTSARAENELGYRHRPAHDALADAVHWFESRAIRSQSLSQRGAAGFILVTDDLCYQFYNQLIATGMFTGLF